MKELIELQKQILKQEFPQISFSDDLDVERYFDLRRNGFMNEALSLYNRKLKIKYPDDKMRFDLLSSYRKKSTRFQDLLIDNLIELANVTIIKIKNIINVIVLKIANLDMDDVYTVVQQCELIVAAISKDRFVAISFTEKYARYAKILNYKKNEMRKSAEIIRMYVTDALSSVRAYKEEQSDIALSKKSSHKSYKAPSVFDFSKIIFTKSQKDAIVISENIKSTEDKVIAYILKYWELYANSAFENAVLLYSRKYKTKHFNIFQAVKIGRFRNWKDEEILHAVLSNVVSGYYYSISGDLYLQKQWNKAKASLKLEARKKMEAITYKERKTKNKIKNKQKNIRSLDPVKKKTDCVINKKKAKKNNSIQDKYIKNKSTVEIKSKTKKNKITHSNLEIINSMSISEMVMKLTGTKYKMHQGIFFATIRKSIRKELNKQNTMIHSVFGDERNDAENLIYSFFEDNYDNPFQNWLKSKQHAEIIKLGCKIDEIESIVKDWAKNERK